MITYMLFSHTMWHKAQGAWLKGSLRSICLRICASYNYLETLKSCTQNEFLIFSLRLEPCALSRLAHVNTLLKNNLMSISER